MPFEEEAELRNRYVQLPGGDYVLYAPRVIRGCRQASAEVPFYVSASDLERVAAWDGTWTANWSRSGTLPSIAGCSGEMEVTGTMRRRGVKLHRWIYEGRNGTVPAGFVLSYWNHNPVDNRWDNLRLSPSRETGRREKHEKPAFDASGLTVTGIQQEGQRKRDLFGETAYFGSILLVRYRPHAPTESVDERLYMEWDYRIAHMLLIEERPRQEIYNQLITLKMTREQIDGAGLHMESYDELKPKIDLHLKRILQRLWWTPTFLDPA
ncbi:HNH endonuclease [Alicyclobacillus fastidiosus]|uniref:HNH endonuclease n=1 Tax=Alicyclobacillus fastidiosus TaxID=392011 RepID=A0ABY6ZLF9_9BACL|nr:HNH endonuclease signature motif containing protein [Alicyclobacillus fastidiosus]WAH43755.1 HNH endonuclease [Alicyclobacillus fastidiosus]GMA59973.1 hypothetical protein GCM10025859_04130 [Alicyclobacillus fastidiosus]